MKEFINKLLSDSGDVSSKRFAGLISLSSAILLSLIGIIKSVNEHFFDGFLFFSAASLGLTIADNYISKIKKDS